MVEIFCETEARERMVSISSYGIRHRGLHAE